jgi:hypothetical protein
VLAEERALRIKELHNRKVVLELVEMVLMEAVLSLNLLALVVLKTQGQVLVDSKMTIQVMLPTQRAQTEL